MSTKPGDALYHLVPLEETFSPKTYFGNDWQKHLNKETIFTILGLRGGYEVEQKFFLLDWDPAYTIDGQRFIDEVNKSSGRQYTYEGGPHMLEDDTGLVTSYAQLLEEVICIQSGFQDVEKDFGVTPAQVAYVTEMEKQFPFVPTIRQEIVDALGELQWDDPKVSNVLSQLYRQNPQLFDTYPTGNPPWWWVEYYRTAVYSVPEEHRFSPLTCATQGSFSFEDPALTNRLWGVVHQYMAQNKQKYGNFQQYGESPQRRDQFLSFVKARMNVELPEHLHACGSNYYDISAYHDRQDYPSLLSQLYFNNDEGRIGGTRTHYQGELAYKLGEPIVGGKHHGSPNPRVEIRCVDTTHDIITGVENVLRLLLDALKSPIAKQTPVHQYHLEATTQMAEM